ncbi:MAG: membrane protein insertion efficiency factor YidD [bacterium]|nr:membrane protein insertion efficiency factor YidD [bacterium]
MHKKPGIFTKLVLGMLWIYQRTLSPDHGPLRVFSPHGYCRYFPTCSEYATQAVRKFGFWKGSWLAMRRVSRCHPWAQGGLDPIP